MARIQAPLQDALVPEGQEACFSIELSASVIGTWFLNGTQLQDDDRYTTRRSRTHQSLRIRGVRETDNGAEITFIAYGIRDSAALYIQGTFKVAYSMRTTKSLRNTNYSFLLFLLLFVNSCPSHALLITILLTLKTMLKECLFLSRN